MSRIGGNKRLISPMLRLALLLGVLVHLAGFLVFRVLSNDLPVQPKEDAFVAYVPLDSEGGDMDLFEQAALFDSAPLFIPGRWSASSAVLPSSESLGLKVFPDFEPNMNLAEDLRPQRLEFQSRSRVNEPDDLLALEHWDLFRNFSLGDASGVELEDWNPVAEIRVLSGVSGKWREAVVLELPSDLFVGLSTGGGPSVFSISMVAAGMPLGDALMLQSSGSDRADESARSWLLDPRTLAQLPSGLLEIRVFL